MAADKAKQNILLGIFVMFLVTISVVITDSLYKWARVEYLSPVPYVMFARYSGVFILAIAWQVYKRNSLATALHTTKLKWHLFRSSALVGSTICGTLALQYTPLSIYAAVIQFAPVFVLILLQFLPGEQLTKQQWGAVVFGLLGVMIILRPSAQGFDIHWLISLGVVFFWGLFQALTRYLSQTESTSTLMLYNMPVGLLVSVIWIAMIYRPVVMGEFWTLFSIFAISTFTFVALIVAYRLAPAKYIAPIAWLQVIWAFFPDYFIFQHRPDIFVFIGAAFIIASGVWMFLSAQKTNLQTDV
ncbi:MAG: DMT family transporter [Alphaproteobacteria bacterium]